MNVISFFAGCGGLAWDLSKLGSEWFGLMSSSQAFMRPMKRIILIQFFAKLLL